MLAIKQPSDHGPLDFGLTPDGDDIYTLRFDAAPYLPIPVPSASTDDEDYLDEARALVESLVGQPLADWPSDDPELAFPLFALWALQADNGPGVMINHRPAGAPPPPKNY